VVVPAPGRSRELGFISPIVARMAQENQIDLSQVTGTGEVGRITKKDVLAFMEQRPAEQQAPPVSRAAQASLAAEPAPWETPGEGDLFRPTEMVFAKGRPEAGGSQPAAPPSPDIPVQAEEGRVIPHTKMRSLIAEHMVTSKRTSPHVTTVMEADLHRVIAHYNANKEAFARGGARLTYTAYFAVAAVQALRAFPLVNSSWREDGVLIHSQINLGMAVSLGEEGLIVPVIKRAEQLSLLGFANAIGDLANRARGHKLSTDEVRGGTFTITNHGISGSLFATPIINQPQCAILGVGTIQKRVVVIEDQAGGDTIAVRPMVYLSLTFDHRILDGASADGFLAKVVDTLENWS
jgi:2-oxoglutarate dehydrogenase E2 component (dihydrolipoamide succinyltransferase)